MLHKTFTSRDSQLLKMLYISENTDKNTDINKLPRMRGNVEYVGFDDITQREGEEMRLKGP